MCDGSSVKPQRFIFSSRMTHHEVFVSKELVSAIACLSCGDMEDGPCGSDLREQTQGR